MLQTTEWQKNELYHCIGGQHVGTSFLENAIATSFPRRDTYFVPGGRTYFHVDERADSCTATANAKDVKPVCQNIILAKAETDKKKRNVQRNVYATHFFQVQPNSKGRQQVLLNKLHSDFPKYIELCTTYPSSYVQHINK